MDLLIVLAAGLLPPLFILLYIRHLDTEPEPTGQIVKATVFGIIACVPIIVAEIIIAEILYSGVDMSGLRGSVLQAFLGASLPEEAFKLLALWLVLRNNRHFNQHFDGIVYAVCVGLGFAAVENVRDRKSVV